MLDRFDDLADGLNHPEGVTWNPFDGLVYAGGEGGELYAVTLDGEVEQAGRPADRCWGSRWTGGVACTRATRARARSPGSIRRRVPWTRTRGGWTATTWTCPNVAAFGPDGAALRHVLRGGRSPRDRADRAGRRGRTERWSAAVPALPERVPGDARRGRARRRGGEGGAHRPRPIGAGRVSRRSRDDRRRSPTRTRTGSRSTPTATTGSRSIVPTALCASPPTERRSSWWTTTSRRRSTRPRTSLGSARHLDRVVVSQRRRDHVLSIADVGVAGLPFHYPRCRRWRGSPIATSW